MADKMQATQEASTAAKKAFSDIEGNLSKVRIKHEETFATVHHVFDMTVLEQEVVKESDSNPLVVVRCAEAPRQEVLKHLSNSFRKYKFSPIKFSISLIGVYPN